MELVDGTHIDSDTESWMPDEWLRLQNFGKMSDHNRNIRKQIFTETIRMPIYERDNKSFFLATFISSISYTIQFSLYSISLAIYFIDSI